MEEKKTMLQVAVAAMQDKKGEGIVQLHIGERSVIADDFLIVSGSSRSPFPAAMMIALFT